MPLAADIAALAAPGTGAILGNPVDHEPCSPTLAVERLNADIFGLGPQGDDILTK